MNDKLKILYGATDIRFNSKGNNQISIHVYSHAHDHSVSWGQELPISYTFDETQWHEIKVTKRKMLLTSGSYDEKGIQVAVYIDGVKIVEVIQPIGGMWSFAHRRICVTNLASVDAYVRSNLSMFDYEFEEESVTDLYDLPQPDIGDSAGFGDSGSGGASSGNSGDGDGENNTSDHNENIKYEDEETKELIEPLLDSISQDCMGKTLLDALDGVTIKTHPYSEYLNYNNFDYENNIIHLEADPSGSYRDYILLEELIHRYQYQQGFTTKCIEKEVEAKVGWVLYLERHERHLTTSQANAQLGDASSGILSLADALSRFRLNQSYDLYNITYQESINNLRKWYPENEYPYLGNISLKSLENLNNLLTSA